MIVSIHELGHAEARRLETIPSSYTTDEVFQFEFTETPGAATWHLIQRRLPNAITREYDGGDLREMLSTYGDALSPKTVRYLAAFGGGRVMGLLTFKCVEWNDTIWLVDIRIRAEQRQRGIGSALVEELKSRARDTRRRGISVETQTTNVGAVKFYQKLGFRVSGFDDRLYPSDDVALFLFWDAPAH